LLHSRCAGVSGDDLQAFWPSDQSEEWPLQCAWQAISETLVKMRSRVAEGVINLKKLLAREGAEAPAAATAEEFTRNCNIWVSCLGFFTRYSPSEGHSHSHML
jgi:hypothetical protein